MSVQEHEQLLQLEQATLADVEQYGKCSLKDKVRVQQLTHAIENKLSLIRALTRDLELVVEEADSDEERQQVEAVLAQHKGQYASIQAAFKHAALAQRTAALRSAEQERRELLAGADGAARQRKLQTEADAVALAEDVTSGLRRTRQLLAEELEHTSATLAAMEASHGQLAKTRDEYTGQHTRLKRSRGLLGTLNWQAKSETYMLWFGLSLFVLVCAYIFQKRAAHFVPNALKPGALLRAAGLSGSKGSPTPPPLPPAQRAPAQQQEQRWETQPNEHAAYQPYAPYLADGDGAAGEEGQEPLYEPYQLGEVEEAEPSVYAPEGEEDGEQALQEGTPSVEEGTPSVEEGWEEDAGTAGQTQAYEQPGEAAYGPGDPEEPAGEAEEEAEEEATQQPQEPVARLPDGPPLEDLQHHPGAGQGPAPVGSSSSATQSAQQDGQLEAGQAELPDWAGQPASAAADGLDSAVWPEGAPTPHTEPGSPAHARMHLSEQHAASREQSEDGNDSTAGGLEQAVGVASQAAGAVKQAAVDPAEHLAGTGDPALHADEANAVRNEL